MKVVIKKICMKGIFALLFLFCLVFAVYGQNTSPIDLILVLDTSSSMAHSYDDVNDYITGSFLRDFLRIGDTFHLITYAGPPRLDAARRINGLGDVETIIGRMLIQYPIETAGVNDLRIAINFAEVYASSLPSREKKIIIVGVGRPEAESLVRASAQRLNALNMTIDFVNVTPGQPLASLPASRRPSALTARPASSSVAETSTRSEQRVSGETGTMTDATGETSSAAESSSLVSAASSLVSGVSASAASQAAPSSISEASSSAAPSSVSEEVSSSAASEVSTESSQTDTESSVIAEDQMDAASGGVSADTTASSQRGITVEESYGLEARRGGNFAPSLPLIIGIIAVLLLLGLVIFLVSRRLGSSPNRVIAGASSSKPAPVSAAKEPAPYKDHSKDLAIYAAVQKQRTTPYTDRPKSQPTNEGKSVVINPTGPLLLNLYVEDQCTSIGKRNIHSLKSGYRFTVGGGKSDDYYIFLVPIPAGIGEIRRNGSQLTFIPKKPRYFPDLGSSEVRDCINKTIRIVSDRNYEIRFMFEMYEDPLVALNRMLHCVDVPG